MLYFCGAKKDFFEELKRVFWGTEEGVSEPLMVMEDRFGELKRAFMGRLKTVFSWELKRVFRSFFENLKGILFKGTRS